MEIALKIIITTTFRDFKGNINDKMQIQFLKSLKRQTYQDYALVVTLFGEKNVENIVRKALGEKAVFFNSVIGDNHRYSLTKVILNGIDYGRNEGADILIDCSGDIILQNNFLETVVNNYYEFFSGISHPNIFFDIDDNFKVIGKRVGECNRGIDIRFFDFSLLIKPDVYNIIQRYIFFDWGGFEHFLAAIAMKYSSRMVNVFSESKVVKFENNRENSNESERYLKKSHISNSRTLVKAALRMNIDTKKIFDLYFIHLQYHSPQYFSSNIHIFQKEFWQKMQYYLKESNNG